MSKEKPDHHDGELVLKMYDLRREPLLRASRETINGQFWPASADEAVAIGERTHPMNTAFRQVIQYWEMVYGFARHGVVNPNFLVENNGEGLFVYAKFAPYLEPFRAAHGARSFLSSEWVATQTSMGKAMFEGVKSRIDQRTTARA